MGANSNLSLIRATSRADQAGASLKVQWSLDGTTFYDAADGVVTTPALGATVAVESKIQARYARIVYTNGSTAQGSFTLLASLISL